MSEKRQGPRIIGEDGEMTMEDLTGEQRRALATALFGIRNRLDAEDAKDAEDGKA